MNVKKFCNIMIFSLILGFSSVFALTLKSQGQGTFMNMQFINKTNGPALIASGAPNWLTIALYINKDNSQTIHAPCAQGDQISIAVFNKTTNFKTANFSGATIYLFPNKIIAMSSSRPSSYVVLSNNLTYRTCDNVGNFH